MEQIALPRSSKGFSEKRHGSFETGCIGAIVDFASGIARTVTRTCDRGVSADRHSHATFIIHHYLLALIT